MWCMVYLSSSHRSIEHMLKSIACRMFESGPSDVCRNNALLTELYSGDWGLRLESFVICRKNGFVICSDSPPNCPLWIITGNQTKTKLKMATLETQCPNCGQWLIWNGGDSSVKCWEKFGGCGTAWCAFCEHIASKESGWRWGATPPCCKSGWTGNWDSLVAQRKLRLRQSMQTD